MDEHEWLAEQFEANRSHLQAVAYRMLGSLSEADDAVQESWLHLSRSDTSGVENLGGWLTTVVARVCLELGHRLHPTPLRTTEFAPAQVPSDPVPRPSEPAHVSYGSRSGHANRTPKDLTENIWNSCHEQRCSSSRER